MVVWKLAKYTETEVPAAMVGAAPRPGRLPSSGSLDKKQLNLYYTKNFI